MELVLPMYNVHPYFSLKNLGKSTHYTQQNTMPSQVIRWWQWGGGSEEHTFWSDLRFYVKILFVYF